MLFRFCPTKSLLQHFTKAISHRRRMRVVPIPANADNYMYLIVDNSGANKAAIVDPVDVEAVIKTSKKEGVNLTGAFVTHHHWDHAGGTGALKQTFNDVHIYGGDGERIEAIDSVLEHGDQFELGTLKVKALRTPCHTSTHVCYYVVDENSGEKAVFTGDTLFIGGCGRFFEGTAEQMDHALNQQLAKLPNETLVYCGHEYTVQNLKFALSVDPQNTSVKEKLAWAEGQRASGKFTIPSTIGEEKSFNPFMRVNDPAIQSSCGTENDPIATMAKLRERKNNFKG